MDKYDIPFLIRDIQNEMVIHEGTASKTPMEYGPFPKNLNKYKEKIQNKFYNKHLAYLEELEYMKKQENLIKWFKSQHISNFTQLDIGNHDGFLTKAKNFVNQEMNSNVLACGFLINSFIISTAGVPGADLLSQEQGTSIPVSGWNTQAWCDLLADGTVTELYDQIAISIATASGNHRLACYDDGGSGRDPVNLYSETGSLSSSADYNFTSVTEFGLDTVKNHTAYQTDNGTENPHHTQTSSTASLDGQTYGSFPDPYTNTNTIYAMKMKIGHT